MIPAPAPKRRIRRFLRFVARMFFLIILALAGITTVLFFAPLSFEWSDRLIKERWLEATGLRLDFLRAEWAASRGYIFIEKPVLYDAETGESLVDLESFELRVDPFSIARVILKRENRLQIDEIALGGPLWIGFEEREGKIVPEEKLARAYETFRSKVKAASKNGIGARFGQASLSGLFISLDRVEGEKSSPLLLVQNAIAIAEFNSLADVANVVLVGSLRGETGATTFNLMLQPRAQQDEVSIDLTLQPFDSERHLMADLASDFRTSPVKARGNIRREEDGHWALYSSAKIPELTLVAAGPRGEDQAFADASIDATLDWRGAQQRLDLRAFDLKSSHFDVAASGQISLAAPHPYRVLLSPAKLRGRGLALLERGVFGENRITKPDQGVFQVRGEVSGMIGEERFSSVVGRVSLSDISLSLENLPEPILGIRLEADVTTTALTIAEGFGVFQGVPVSVTGRMTGKPAEGKIDSADLAWQTTGDLAGISDLISKNGEGPATDMTFKGKVTGNGRFRVKNPELKDWAKLVEEAEIDGQFMFDDAELTHREVARPIRNLSGTFAFDRRRATLTGVSGAIEDIAFSVSGTLEGPVKFWEDAAADLALEAEVDLARVEEYCDWFEAERPKIPPRTGKARVQAKLRGPLARAEALAYEGRIAATDFSVTPEEEKIAGTIRFPEIEAEFSANHIRVPQTRGEWEGIQVIADADLSPAAGTLRVKAEGPMTAYQAALTGVLGEFSQVGGEATADFSFGVAPADAAAPAPANFTELWKSLAEKSKDPDFRIENLYKPSMEGRANLINATLLFDTMPPSAILTEIYGTLIFDNDGLHTLEPAQIKAGEGAVNTRAEARIGFPKEGETTVLDFDLTGSKVDLDSWVKKWIKVPPNPKRRRISGSPFDDAAAPKLRIQVRAHSDEVRFRGADGKNLNGSLEFATYGPRRTKLSWTDATADFKQGGLRVSGDWTREMDRERMRHSATVTDMDVADIFTMAYKQPKQGGLETGRVTGFAEVESLGVKDAPYNGRGRVLVTDSRFISNSIFGVLGGALGLESFFQEISFSKIEGDFAVENGAVRTENLLFEHPLKIHPLNLRMSGTIGPERKIDLDVHLQFLPVVGEIPIIGPIWKTINQLTGKVLKYKISGTLETPALATPAAGAAP